MGKKIKGYPDTKVQYEGEKATFNPDGRIYHARVKPRYSVVDSMLATSSNWFELREFLEAREVTIVNYGSDDQHYEFSEVKNTYWSGRISPGQWLVKQISIRDDVIFYETYSGEDYTRIFEDYEAETKAEAQGGPENNPLTMAFSIMSKHLSYHEAQDLITQLSLAGLKFVMV